MLYVGFIIATLLLLWISRKIHHTWINAFTVLTAPYVFIVLFNKVYGEKQGFYPITDSVLWVVFGGLFFFFIGTAIVALLHLGDYKKLVQVSCEERIQEYRIGAMIRYSILVLLIGYAKVGYIVLTQGLYGITQEGALVSGIVGHLIFTVYPLQPILLLFWLKNKKRKWCLVTVALTTVLLFASFVKYHIICYFVMIYLFLVLNERKYLKKATLLLLSLVAAIFIANYVVGFISQNVLNRVSNQFYVNHLWKYIAGAVINGDAYYKGAMGANATVGYKILSFLFAFPNMFISALTGSKVFPYKGGALVLVSNVGEYSNVVDAISYMFSNLGDVAEVVFGLFYFMAFGVLMEIIYVHSIKKAYSVHITVSTFFAFFVFFSFFGTFYINSMPWEIAIYSVVVPALFSRRLHFVK